MTFLPIRTMACLTSAIALVAGSSGAHAQSRSVYNFNLPAQDLADALLAISRVSGREVIYPLELVRGHRARALTRVATADEAIEALLVGSDLEPQFRSDVVVIRRRKISDGVSSRDQDGADIVVTGSRIARAAVAAPVLSISQEQMRQAGQNNLGEVIRSLPQNFGGGQNPGVAFGANSTNLANANVTGGSAINLRGLGPDATLTLLNGRRLSYGGSSQAVDVSSIPVSAVDRIEVVSDGASAIYGSDAVAGVANIILKPDYDGLSISARRGVATDGGGLQQQYNLVTGTKWSSGGFIATYDFERDRAIYADQRSYTAYVTAPQTILPSLQQHSFLASAHQSLGSSISFSIDGLYNRRRVDAVSTLTTVNYSKRFGELWSISPTIRLRLPHQWAMTLGGTYSQDDVIFDQPSYTQQGVLQSRSRDCYCNSITAVEMDIDGTLFDLPAGAIRVAAGGGYRRNTFEVRSLISTSFTGGQQHSNFVFGEFLMPVVAPGQQVPLVNRLSFSGAFRHENYSTFGGITTPKIGIIYSPVGGIELKGSWSRSFKAPTLLQQNQPAYALLFRAANFGLTASSSNPSVLIAFGGNPSLTPESATNWSTTLSIAPTHVPGLHADISYYSIHYRDRVLQPIGNLFSAFSNPAYAEFVIPNPPASQLQTIIDRAGSTRFINYTGRPYDPTTVVGAVNDYLANIAAQAITGIDLNVSYRTQVGSSSVTLIGQASRIESQQRNTRGSPVADLAGTVFNPPSFRARAGFTLKNAGLAVSPFLNYLAGVRDTRSTDPVDGASMATVDLTVIYDMSDRGSILDGLTLSLSAQNISNERPPYLRNISQSVVNYDSTNYSPIGRFINFTIAKRW
ncbi:TonB-dependent receptor [Sphingomonas sp. 1185]|uniref:TonB-dependent receptor domain-containing protein n=1 Tax=Sphingomonas sp. 1185 TaxID=3156411 RepID=UPI00339AFC65